VEKVPMLEVTYRRLSEELEQLKSEERGKIALIIDKARELGDLKENAEYHSAKEQQGLMEARISELTDLVGRAQVIEPSKLAHQRVSFGSTVVLTDQDTDEEVTYIIVGTQESNPSKGLISIASPMVRALLGKEEGDEVEINLPAGLKIFDVEEVKYTPIEL
jgi:transcription elongation factor GreA